MREKQPKSRQWTPVQLTIAAMQDEQGMSIGKAPHPRQKVFIRTEEDLPQLQLPLIIRRNVK